MGIFDKVFKSQRDISKEELVEVPWHQLNKISELEKLEKESEEYPIGIFKHSTRCGISKMVLKQFETEYRTQQPPNLKLYFLDLLNHRDISNEIASRYNIIHESPQFLVMKNKEIIYHDSHQSIDLAKINKL